MKRTQTTITKEYDKDGSLVSEIKETVVEEDDGYIYPQSNSEHFHSISWLIPSGAPCPARNISHKHDVTIPCASCELY